MSQEDQDGLVAVETQAGQRARVPRGWLSTAGR